jgi:hypothetical protein
MWLLVRLVSQNEGLVEVRRLVIQSGFLLMLVLAVAGCGVLGERGSGNLATETRDVSDFDQVDLSGSATVLIEVTGTQSLTIEAEDNILPLLTTEVTDGTLELGSSQRISPTRDVVYTITVVSLEAVAVSGSGSVTATSIDADAFNVEINGSGTVIPDGVSESLEVSISGSGAFEGEDLESATGTVSVSGSGDAVVNVTDDLDVKISGSGNVQYLGDPKVSVSTSGSGKVSER